MTITIILLAVFRLATILFKYIFVACVAGGVIGWVLNITGWVTLFIVAGWIALAIVFCWVLLFFLMIKALHKIGT